MTEFTQTQKTSKRVFGRKADLNACKPASEGNVGVSPLCPIYVRYKDHVIFKNISAPSPISVVRETIGWVKEQNDELLLIENDRAIPSQGRSVNGIVILKNCILEAYALPLQNISEWVLSSGETKSKVELAFRPSERKTHGAKDSKRKDQP
jgi:hypothetical protein